MSLVFSEYFGVKKDILDAYGAFDVSLASDLPLFIDPFLLYDSEGNKYKPWHDEIVKYLQYIHDLSAGGRVGPKEIKYYYGFPEVKQNWFGFTLFGNEGRGLGPKFGVALDSNLSNIFSNFGNEEVTSGSHLEKLCLIKDGVGKDSISDFTTNLVKKFLLEYTQAFALANIDESKLDSFLVDRAYFDYKTGLWRRGRFTLPKFDGTFVLLTPRDILTRDEAWINRSDLYENFESIPPAITNEDLRREVSNHFYSQLSRKSKKEDKVKAAVNTVISYPETIDYYIKSKEENAEAAHEISSLKVVQTDDAFNLRLPELIKGLKDHTDFYEKGNSYEECLRKVHEFKDYIEHNDGYKVIQAALKVVRKEEVVQLFFGLAWLGSSFDFNREVNNGRGSVDFKVSKGSKDKSLIEFKLASNSGLKDNLLKQVEIYKQANRTPNGIKVIFVTNEKEAKKVEDLLNTHALTDKEDVIVIDARTDNKESASTVKA